MDPIVAAMLALLLVSFAASLVVVVVILVRLPADYLCAAPTGHDTVADAPLLLWLRTAARNAAGALLVALGLVLAVPGLPGQGLLTIAAGLVLLDFPGTRGLLRTIFGQRHVLGAVNRLRARFSRPPLIVETRGPEASNGQGP